MPLLHRSKTTDRNLSYWIERAPLDAGQLSTMSIYEFAILGDASHEERTQLSKTIKDMVDDFNLDVGHKCDVRILDAGNISERDPRFAFVAAYFGTSRKANKAEVETLIKQKAIVIPVVNDLNDFQRQTPECLHPFNGIQKEPGDSKFTRLAVIMLENVGLLRSQRRVFLSYRRTEATESAVQLFEAFASRNFDVFLDTHSIRPGDPFQEELVHKLCDSDVLMVLETPGYYESTWTKEELQRAIYRGVRVLRIVWPTEDGSASKSDDRYTLSESIFLESDQIATEGRKLQDDVIDRIVTATESLRSRSIAARYKSLASAFNAEIQKIHGNVEGIGSNNLIVARLNNGKVLWVFPSVVFPSAETLNDAHTRASAFMESGEVFVLYDRIGMNKSRQDHLKWLDDHVRSVKAINIERAGWQLISLGV